MTGLILNLKEKYMYDIILDYIDGKISKNRAAIKLGVSTRTIERRVKKYKLEGISSFSHKNKNKKPINCITDETKESIIRLYNNKYFNSNFKHFTSLLASNEGINVSESFVRKLMYENNIISPKCLRRTKRQYLKSLKQQNNVLVNIDVDNMTDKEIEYSIIDLCDAHPRRERAKYEGELIQMDASVHLWFGDLKTHLHAAIDDASGKIVGLYFDKEETLKGYQNVFHQILTNYGIPYEFLTDRRTIFEYKKKNVPSLEKDTFTQFGYSCHQLGTTITTSSIPQTKGRIERLFNTLQSRLPVELRVNNIQTIEEANQFLLNYITEFNELFALQLNNNKNSYESVENINDIDLILSTLCSRKIDNGGCLSYKNKYYYPIDCEGKKIILTPKSKVLVIKTFNDELYMSVNETIYTLIELQQNKETSNDFDLFNQKERALIGKFTPAMSHPWKRKSYLNYIYKKSHLTRKEKEQFIDYI